MPDWLNVAAAIAGIVGVGWGLKFAAFSYFDRRLTRNEKYRRDRAEDLRHPHIARLYEGWLDGALGLLRSVMRAPWSLRAFNVCLTVGLVYSFLFLFLPWGFAGGRSLVGQSLLLPDWPPGRRSSFGAGILLYLVILYYLAWRLGRWPSMRGTPLAGAVILAGAVTLALGGAGAVAGAEAGAGAIALTVTLAVAVALATAVAATSAGALALAVAMVLSAAVAGAGIATLAVAAILGIFGAVAVGGAEAGAEAAAITLTVALPLALAAVAAGAVAAIFLRAAPATLAVAMILAVVGVGDVAGAEAGAVALDLARDVALAGAVAFALAIAGAIAGAFVSARAGALTDAVAGAVAGAGAVAAAGAIALTVAPAVLGSLGIDAVDVRADPAVQALMLFWVILPVANALWDWVSWWASRGLGKHLLDTIRMTSLGFWRKAWAGLWHAGLDFLLALAFLALLARTLPWGIGLFNGWIERLGGTAPFELTDYLCAAAREPWTTGLWATLMLLSTLVPTALHATAAVASPLAAAALLWQRDERLATRLMTEAPNSPGFEAAVDDAAAHLACTWFVVWILAGVLVTLVFVGLLWLFNLITGELPEPLPGSLREILLGVALWDFETAAACLAGG